MAIFTTPPACAHPIQFQTPRVLKGGPHFPLGKLFWISGCNFVQNSRSLKVPWSLCNSRKRCFLVYPRESFIFEPPGCQLSELGQNIIRFFQIETAVAANLFPELGPEQSQSENLLHHLPAIPAEISVAAVALLLGTSFGYLISKGVISEASDGSDATSECLSIMKLTPFNRFVMVLCPSIKFRGMDAYGGLSKKLTGEGYHVVEIQNASLTRSDQHASGGYDSPFFQKDSGWVGRVLLDNYLSRGQVGGKESNMEEHMLTYQRIFLHTKDGGVLAIDWPSHLELSSEHGLDTTILLVPGFSNGSKDKGIQEFVQRCVKHGYFPIVLNPRGCGGSPLTTPRWCLRGKGGILMCRKACQQRQSGSLMKQFLWF